MLGENSVQAVHGISRNVHAWIASVDGVLAGIQAAYFDPAHGRAHSLLSYVRPEFRREGLYRAMQDSDSPRWLTWLGLGWEGRTIVVLVLAAVLAFGLRLAFRPQPVFLEGEVEATEIDVAAKVPGRVESVAVKLGQTVARGEVLFTIESPELRAKLTQAEGARDVVHVNGPPRWPGPWPSP